MKKYVFVLLLLVSLLGHHTFVFAGKQSNPKSSSTTTNLEHPVKIAVISSSLGKDTLHQDQHPLLIEHTSLPAQAHTEVPHQLFDIMSDQRELPVRFLSWATESDTSSIAHKKQALDQIDAYNQNRPNHDRIHIVYIDGNLTVPSDSSPLRGAIQKLHRQGTVVITPADAEHNDVNGSSSRVIPAVYPETISVSAVRRKNSRWTLSRFSSFGEEVDLTYKTKIFPFYSPRASHEPEYAASVTVQATARLMTDARRKTGNVPTPKTVRKQLIAQADHARAHKNGWKYDPDNQAEPMLNPDVTFQKSSAKPYTIEGDTLKYSFDLDHEQVDIVGDPHIDRVKQLITKVLTPKLHELDIDVRYPETSGDQLPEQVSVSIPLSLFQEKATPGADGKMEFLRFDLSTSARSSDLAVTRTAANVLRHLSSKHNDYLQLTSIKVHSDDRGYFWVLTDKLQYGKQK